MTRHTPLFDELVDELGRPEGFATVADIPEDVRKTVINVTGPLIVAAYLRELATERASIGRAELLILADELEAGQG